MRFTTPLAFPSSAWLLLSESVKTDPCCHCKKKGSLKSHGALRGAHLSKPEKELRGIRFFCSNRYSNKGCGRTFSILFSSMIPALSLRAKQLTHFFKELLQKDSIHAAWHGSHLPFSLRSAYRWVKKFQLNQSTIRSAVYSTLPNEDASPLAPHLETIRYLQASSSGDFVEAFQLQHQTSIFPEKQSTNPS